MRVLDIKERLQSGFVAFLERRFLFIDELFVLGGRAGIERRAKRGQEQSGEEQYRFHDLL